MVLIEQTEALLDYLEGNQELALGHTLRTREGRRLSKRCWTDCARLLNSVSADCPQRSADEWRSYYNEFKYKTLKKVKSQKAVQGANGCLLSKRSILTNSQERLMKILGWGIVDPLAVKVKVKSEREPIPEPEHQVTIDSDSVYIDSHNSSVPGSPASAQDTPDPPVPAQTETGEPPQRRRRLRRAKQQQTRNADYTHLKASQERLERIEERNANAILEQAKAINRLAAAVEKAVERLGEPLTIVLKQEERAENR